MFKRQLIFWVTFLHCSTHLQTRTRSLFKCFLEWEKIGNQVEVRAGSHGKGRSKNSYFSFFLDAFIIRASFWSVLSSENDHFRIPPNTLCSPPRPCPHYHVVLETHRSILVHTTVLMRFLLSSLERQKTRLWYFRSPFSFRYVFYRPHYYKCMRFRFDHFQERFQIDSFQTETH